MEADQDHDGKISFEEFTKMVENTDVSMSMTLGMFLFCVTRQVTALDILTFSFFYRSILAVRTAIPAGSVARRCVLNSCWGTGYQGMGVTKTIIKKLKITSASTRRANHTP